ncbi:uncharacterized protein EKO05_0009315 [Ascochyta rabiei]|uniref:Uncharacterized protein n=1 Tax=Didymella rabiei TaxID=5454 RepID=A0A163EUW5_DIDRA|nr:uncharacterized protein EKO05_0009315 [Ascochyta rabiei]KZM23938.1 hypothetical protein ST47_g4890 [Ascochyta rabiei]UPX19039.1 hypothetical protein EKO05_0009315 [Ascochyta rabiei]
MSATAPTFRKDSAQSSKERVGMAFTQESGPAKPQYSNTTTSVPIQSSHSHSRVSRYASSSKNTVAGPGPSTTQKAAEPRQENHTDHINNRDEENSRAPVTSVDIVTNKERAKPPIITRVLSPMRARRTPVLVNAPDVRWRLDPRLRQIPSLDSILSSSTTSASETSTVRLIPILPHNIALPSSVASSLFTVMPEANPVRIPLPPSPPPTSVADATRHSEAVERRTPSEEHYFQQTHHLSPVTEVSSGFSVRSLGSSIVDLEVQDIATAERHGLDEVAKQSVHIMSCAHSSQVSLSSQQSRQGRFQERFGLDVMDHHADSPRSGGISETPVVSGVDERGERGFSGADEEYARLERTVTERKKARTICGRLKNLTRKLSGVGAHAGLNVVRKLGKWAGFECA